MAGLHRRRMQLLYHTDGPLPSGATVNPVGEDNPVRADLQDRAVEQAVARPQQKGTGRGGRWPAP